MRPPWWRSAPCETTKQMNYTKLVAYCKTLPNAEWERDLIFSKLPKRVQRELLEQQA